MTDDDHLPPTSANENLEKVLPSLKIFFNFLVPALLSALRLTRFPLPSPVVLMFP